MKRFASVLLALALALTLCCPALAAGEEYTLALTANGGATATVKPGDTVTVALTLSKNGETDFDLYAMQDYVRFDPAYLELVADSIQVYTVREGEQAREVFRATAQPTEGSADRVFVNRAGTAAEPVASGVQVLTFRLKALKEGSTSLTHDTVQVFEVPGQLYTVAQKTAAVTIAKDTGGGGGSGAAPGDPMSKTETEVVGSVTIETTTTISKNKDGSITTDILQTTTDKSTGERTESRVSETVFKDGSTVRKESKTTLAADGNKVEEKMLDLTDQATGASTSAHVVTDGTGRTTATAKTEARAEARAGADGTATASVDHKTAEKLVEQAKRAAETAKDADRMDHAVVVNVSAPKDEAVTALTVVVPKTAADALAVETKADMVVDTPIASVTVPNEALAALSGTKGDSLVIKAAQAGDGAVTVTVAVDGAALDQVAGGLRAVLPDKRAGAGTVAVLVKADGTEKIIRKSAAADGRMTVPLEGSATVKLVENGKHFSDTESHWAEESVAFVTARELFQGVGGDRFAPDMPMTRGMLVTVLSRLEDEPAAAGAGFRDVDEGAWYAQAVAWASEEKIVTGTGDGTFAPEAPVTREQLAAILYRYAQAMGRDTGMKGGVDGFADGSAVSGWARDAMEYAVGAGILTGKDGGRLDPAGEATRAEVAAVLQRMVEQMA